MIAPKPPATIPTTPPHTKRWGFAIYRCDYSDESQWKSYMTHFKRAVRDELHDIGAPLGVWGRLDWTVLESQKDLDGISKEDIQERFIALDDKSLTMKMPVCPHSGWRLKHKYDSCIYVDKWCLDTLDLHEDWLDRGAPGPFQPVICAVLNDMSSLDKKRAEKPIDDSNRPYTGWVYTHVGCLSNLCPNILHHYPMPPKSPPAMSFRPDQHGL